VSKIIQDNEKVILQSVQNKHLNENDLKKLTYTFYYCSKFFGSIKQIEPLFKVFLDNHGNKLDEKSILLVLNIICRNEDIYSKYEDKVKRIILENIETFDLYNLSQILYEYYNFSAYINSSGLHLVEISQIMTEVQDKLENIASFGHKENRAVTNILLFMREFLYDDIIILTDILETVTNFKNKSDLTTIAMLVHTITTCNVQDLFSELPALYYLAFKKSLEVKVWNTSKLESLKNIWSSMTVSQIYPIEFLEMARVVFTENIENIPFLSLRSIIINISDLLLEEVTFFQNRLNYS